MRSLIVFIFLLTTVVAWDGIRKKVDPEVNERAARAQRIEKEKGEASVTRESLQEREEEKINDDFDPELDPIDSELTPDEGIYDEQ